MKRLRNSSVTERVRKESGQVTQSSGSSFSDLPRDILLNIILRRSIKRIFVCKCVCKIWYDLVSNSEFAKLHFDQAQDYPLIQDCKSRMVYLVQPDKDDFERKFGMCDHTHFKSGCVCNVWVKLDTTTFKIPEINECVKLRKKDESFKYYTIANSCNGMLCLLDLSGRRPPVVCNPITGEFIDLPKARKIAPYRRYHTSYGLGFSPASKQYKVIKMFQVGDQNLAQVHILGTKNWKCIGSFSQPIPKSFCAYSNGFLYWTYCTQPRFVFSFDIENERFGSIPAPSVDKQNLCRVLGEEFCIFRVLEDGSFHAWAWKDHGTKKAWSKVFSFDMSPNYTYITRRGGTIQPLKYLNNGALLMFHSYLDEIWNPKCALIYMDPKRHQFRCLKIHEMDPTIEVISYTPSFVTLKHALTGKDVKVHNVASRCAELKKVNDVAIVEEEFYPELDPHFSYDSDANDSG